MFKLLGKIFGSEKALDKIVTSTASGLDKLYYTEEEKAEDRADSRSEARKMVIAWMETTKGQNLARRLLAMMISSVWLLGYILGYVMLSITPWTDSFIAEKLKISADTLIDASWGMNSPVMLILTFYFAAPHMGSIVGSVIESMKNRIKK